MPTGSRSRASRSPCSSSSSTSDSADPSPTAASITGQTRSIARKGGSKPPIIAPTPPSNASSNSWSRLDRATASTNNVRLVLSMILRARIYHVIGTIHFAFFPWEARWSSLTRQYSELMFSRRADASVSTQGWPFPAPHSPCSHRTRQPPCRPAAVIATTFAPLTVSLMRVSSQPRRSPGIVRITSRTAS
jgi:hypothetical protein